MKALVFYSDGDIRLEESYPKPVPKQGEVLIRVKAVGICGSDIQGYLGKTGRRIPPMVMGHEFAGIVEESHSERFPTGTRVTAQPILYCGHCPYCLDGKTNLCEQFAMSGVMRTDGAMAEYIVMPERVLFPLPDTLEYWQAAMTEPLAVSVSAVEKAGDPKDKNVFIAGAGTIGLLAVSVLRHLGAANIFVSDISAHRLQLARAIGADYALDASAISVPGAIRKQLKSDGVDLAFEAVGSEPTVTQTLASLKKGGRCIWIGNAAKMVYLDMQQIVTRELSVQGSFDYTNETFGKALEMLAGGGVDLTRLCSRQVTMEEAQQLFPSLPARAETLIKVIVTP